MNSTPGNPHSQQHPPASAVPQGTTRLSAARTFLDPFTTSVGLRIVNAEFKSLLLVLPVGVHSIGRAEECDQLIPHATVSRNHCHVKVDETGIRIEDKESYHGVLVNNQPVQSSTLAPGDIIHLGDVMLTVEFVPNHKLAIETNLRYPGQHRITGATARETSAKAVPMPGVEGHAPAGHGTVGSHPFTNTTAIPVRNSSNLFNIIQRASQRIAKPANKPSGGLSGGLNQAIRYNPESGS